uniref:Uncharacterized protein n=1 Tax=Anopheles dirus TaxID=7168 RepID=A0A182NW97_9DIPT
MLSVNNIASKRSNQLNLSLYIKYSSDLSDRLSSSSLNARQWNIFQPFLALVSVGSKPWTIKQCIMKKQPFCAVM